MIVEHIKTSDLVTNNWSGGTTTQLAIYPKDADYKKQNFLFRLSTAAVETEESEFTKLPEVSRKIMILDGEIKVEHKNRYSKTLKKFDQDEFSGNWDTKSCGKATDFNLMTTGNVKGDIEAITLIDSKNIIINKAVDCYGFYIYTGAVKFQINNKSFEGNIGDMFIILPEQNQTTLGIIPTEKSEIIISKISF